MKRFFGWIFGLRNFQGVKVLTILGVQFKFKNPKWYIKHSHRDEESIKRTEYMDMIQDEIRKEYENKSFNFTAILNNKIFTPNYLNIDCKHNYLNLLLKTPEWHYNNQSVGSNNDFIFTWEIRPVKENYNTIKYAHENNKKIIFVGDSFLRSINTFADKDAKEHFQKGISFTFDDLTSYFDATRPSRLEQMLNDKNLIFSDSELQRARMCIDKIVSNHLTKYNHQPIYEPQIGRGVGVNEGVNQGIKKVLVVDQSYGDMSILKGLGSDKIFENMLKCAIKENPNADIIVKTHPDTIAGGWGYYTDLKQKGNIYTQTTPINPISLIKYCDKVYVCSTQFGFEALMCGKEVHVFGMPFYAGWGLTKDVQKCERRTNKRTLEEVFYAAYILYSYYVNPKTGKQCEIEEAIDYLLNLREEYFNSKIS